MNASQEQIENESQLRIKNQVQSLLESLKKQNIIPSQPEMKQCIQCKQDFTIKQLKDHFFKCDLRKFYCSKCDTNYLQKDKQNHEANCEVNSNSEFFEITCKFCTKKLHWNEFSLHKQTCNSLLNIKNDKHQPIQKQLPCNHCKKQFFESEHENHQLNCLEQIKNCQYCSIDIKITEFGAHQLQCQKAYFKCSQCENFIKFIEKIQHLSNCNQMQQKKENSINGTSDFYLFKKICDYCTQSYKDDSHLRICGQKFEQQKLEQQKIEQQKLQKEKLEQQKIEQLKLQQQKLQQQKHEQLKIQQQKIKQQKIEQQKIEQSEKQINLIKQSSEQLQTKQQQKEIKKQQHQIIQQIIKKPDVYCKYCNFDFKDSEIKKHQLHCESQFMNCKLCKVEIHKDKQKQHECRKYECRYCQKEVEGSQHDIICGKKTYKCICGEIVRLSMLKDHNIYCTLSMDSKANESLQKEQLQQQLVEEIQIDKKLERQRSFEKQQKMEQNQKQQIQQQKLQLTCKYCFQQYNENEDQEHFAKCIEKLISCEGCQGAFPQSLMFLHKEECQQLAQLIANQESVMLKRNCVNCNRLIPQNQMEKHRNECCIKLVKCEYCDQMIYYEQLDEHELTCFGKRELNRLIQLHQEEEKQFIQQENIQINEQNDIIEYEFEPRGFLQYEAKTCSICTVHYQPKEIIKMLSCNHRFHKVCIDAWIQKQNRCPMCNRVI